MVDSLENRLTFRLSPVSARGRFRTHSMNTVLATPGTDVYYIRPWKSRDLGSLVKNIDTVFLHPRIPSPYTNQNGKEWIQINQQSLDKMSKFLETPGATWSDHVPAMSDFAIVCKPADANPGEDGQVIGGIGFHFRNFHATVGSSKLNPSTCQLGYWLAANYRDRGIGTSAIKVLIHEYLWGFLSQPPFALDLHRIECEVYYENQRSQWVLEKLGFAREGVIREAIKKGSDWKDLVLYSYIRKS